MTAVQLPSSKELGILAGLADRWTNPYDDHYDRFDHDEWATGWNIGQSLIALVAAQAA